MRMQSFERNLITWSGAATLFVLIVVPFHATLTVWLSQFVGHYTLLRLWKEVLLAVLMVAALYLVVRRHELRQHVLSSRITWLIGLFAAVQLVWGLIALALHQVTPLALGYGWISDTRFLVFFLVVWVVMLAGGDMYKRWPRVIFWPATIVAGFALLQYFVLPYDFMKYLGYGATTVFPYEDINHNVHYIRVMSTLRGANPLGAYLVLVLSLFVVWAGPWLKRWRQLAWWRRSWVIAFVAINIVALVLTFSRGAWLGLLVSAVFLVGIYLWRRQARGVVLLAAGVVIVLTVGLVIGLHNNPTFQNVFLHTEADSTIKTTSNAAHVSAVTAGLHDVIREPLGRGPGTAGPASVYNSGHDARIAENYFIQVGQESGWLGLGLFVLINVAVGRELWLRRHHTLALGLLTALLGVTCVNLFSHGWADDSLAYLWWGLAGIAYALPERKSAD